MESSKIKKILILDDEKSTRSFVSLVVQEMGHTSFMAENGQIGLEIFKAERPDLIISDMVMPVMDGKAFIGNLRKLPEGASVPVIILSGYASVRDVASLLSDGHTYFLKKPVALDDLQEYINRGLK